MYISNFSFVASAETDGDNWSWDDDAPNEPIQKVLTIKQLCNVKNKDGETPLHLAAMAGKTIYNKKLTLHK